MCPTTVITHSAHAKSTEVDNNWPLSSIDLTDSVNKLKAAIAVNKTPSLEYDSLFFWYEKIKDIEASEIMTREEIV